MCYTRTMEYNTGIKRNLKYSTTAWTRMVEVRCAVWEHRGEGQRCTVYWLLVQNLGNGVISANQGNNRIG